MFGWVPPLTYISPFDDPIENLSQFILPAISISVFTLAIVMRMVRATMLEVLGQDYVRTARAKGVEPEDVISQARAAERPDPGRHDRRLRDRRADRAAPRSSRSSSGCPASATRSCRRSSTATTRSIQAMTLMIAFIFIFANLLVDLLYGVLDPRISQE